MKTKQELQKQLIEKTVKNPGFRKQLLANPKAVFEKETGVKLPSSLNLKIIEEEEHTLYLLIPALPAFQDESELTEEELGLLSGGRADSLLICTFLDCPPPDPGG